MVGRRQAVAEQRRYKLQVRFNGSQQGGPPVVGDRADVYSLPNAYQLVESLRIDYGHLGPFGIHP